jgi:glyoxylase-like metal-dependent hydrolase (beta-lactamase superfamily II)
MRNRLTMVLIASGALLRPLSAQQSIFNDALLSDVRAAARSIPGELPRSLHFLPVGELTAPLSVFLENSGSAPVRGIYTAFQVRYGNGWIMIDSGIGRATGPDTTASIWNERYDRVQQGLRGANLVVMTHEHYDHIAGAVRTRYPDIVHRKTLLTRAQAQTLQERADSPSIRLTALEATQYLVMDYERIYPLAPGVVLIKAPGHTPGSQIVYVRLSSGQEALFIGDVVWMMAGLERRLQKPAEVSKAMGENRDLLQQQIAWLSDIMRTDKMAIINSHDAAWLDGLVRRGVLRPDFDLRN